MFLLDQVMQASKAGHRRTPSLSLPSAAHWAAAVASAPIRYVLSDELRDECIDISATRQALLEPTPDTPRVPHETMWAEWRDYRKTPAGELDAGRVGILVHSDPSGRSGTAHIVYESSVGPIMAQMRVDFDFDNPRHTVSEALGLAFPSEPQDRGVGLMLRHCDFRFERMWDRYFEEARTQGKLTREMVVDMVRAVVPDFVFLSTFLLLLGVERMVEERPSELSKLNKARKRAGRHPLLDHVDARLSLSAKSGIGGGGGGRRAAARLHQVRGHLVRRGGKTFWRTTHLRGDAAAGMIATRTVHVTR